MEGKDAPFRFSKQVARGTNWKSFKNASACRDNRRQEALVDVVPGGERSCPVSYSQYLRFDPEMAECPCFEQADVSRSEVGPLGR